MKNGMGVIQSQSAYMSISTSGGDTLLKTNAMREMRVGGKIGKSDKMNEKKGKKTMEIDL